MSTAQKLPLSDGQPGGYEADGRTPGPVLAGALDFVNTEVGQMLNRLQTRGPAKDTAVIPSAKHGQSPTDPDALTRIDDGAVIDALNAAWTANGGSGDLVAASSDDDAMLMWLNDRSPRAERFARAFLLGYDGSGTGSDGQAKATDIRGAAKAYTEAGLARCTSARRPPASATPG